MAGTFAPATNMMAGGVSSWLRYWWVVAIFAGLIAIGGILWLISKYRQKNSQWTHKLITQVELPNGELEDKERVIKMRRWKHKDMVTAPLFELERPLLGSRIFTELEAYCGPTSYKVIVGKDGRLYIPTKTMMNKDTNAKEVSVKHAGIDRARQKYSNDFEKTHATPKKVDLATLLKYGTYITLLIVALILGIQGLKSWGERGSYAATAAQAEAASWEAMGETMESVESALNTVTLLMPDLKALKGNNLQGAIQQQKNLLNQS